MPAVIVAGSYNHDHVWRVDRCPAAGETRRGGDFATGPGGKGFNQAVACARQGAATAFIGAIGDDDLGAIARRIATDAGIDGRWLVRRDAPTGTAAILVEANGQNRIIVDLGANERLNPAHVRAQADAFAGAGVVLCQLENNLDAVATALTLGREHGLLRVLNPAPVHPMLNASLLREVDVLTPNEHEFAMLHKRAARHIDVETIATLSDAELHARCRELGVPTLVVTLGARGVFVSHADAQARGDTAAYYRLSAETVNPIDTTGAGDAFSGALAAAVASRPPFRDAVIRANRVAALSTERRGAAAAMPTRAEVEARFG